MLAAVGKVSACFEANFNCGLCGSLVNDAVIVEPCGHVFCKACHDNQGHHTLCRVCGESKDKVFMSSMVQEYVDLMQA